MKYDILDRVVDVGPPKKPLRRANAEGNLTLVQRLLLYDFLEVCLEYMKLWLGLPILLFFRREMVSWFFPWILLSCLTFILTQMSGQILRRQTELLKFKKAN